LLIVILPFFAGCRTQSKSIQNEDSYLLNRHDPDSIVFLKKSQFKLTHYHFLDSTGNLLSREIHKRRIQTVAIILPDSNYYLRIKCIMSIYDTQDYNGTTFLITDKKGIVLQQHSLLLPVY
jgi:hypothetical protein